MRLRPGGTRLFSVKVWPCSKWWPFLSGKEWGAGEQARNIHWNEHKPKIEVKIFLVFFIHFVISSFIYLRLLLLFWQAYSLWRVDFVYSLIAKGQPVATELHAAARLANGWIRARGCNQPWVPAPTASKPNWNPGHCQWFDQTKQHEQDAQPSSLGRRHPAPSLFPPKRKPPVRVSWSIHSRTREDCAQHDFSQIGRR